MPLGDIAAGLFEIIVRLIVEVLLEIIVKGPGYVLVRISKGKEAEPDGALVITLGVTFWLLIGLGAFFVYLIMSGE